MARFDFCGGSYTVQSVNADAQKCVNLYPEVNELGTGRSKVTLMPTPGLAAITDSAGGNSLAGAPRGQLEFNGRLFVVADVNLYEVTLVATGSYGVRILVSLTVLNGSTPMVNDGLPVSMVASQTQLLIASGGSVYLLVLATNAFSQVPASNFTLATGQAPVIQVAFVDSFFLALIKNSQTISISNVLDGANWNLNGQIVVNVYPENVVGMIVDHREVWLRGTKKSVVYYASGSINVFDVQPGSLIEQGGVAPFAADRLDNSLFWLGGDDKGNAIAWRAVGYNAQRISTHATEFAWQNYVKRSDAVSYTYQRFGHSFWVILFPSANNGNGATWVYDTANGLWHERDFLNQQTGQSMGHPSWNHAFWNETHIVGDWRSNTLYQMDDSFFDNAGTPIRRLRRAPHISTELEVLKHSRFELDLEAGVTPAFSAPPIYMASPNGHIWKLNMTDTGVLQGLQVGTGFITQTVKLTDVTLATTWQVNISNVGTFTTTSITLDITQPTGILFLSTTGRTVWNLYVTSGGTLLTRSVLNPPVISLNNGDGPYVYLRWSDDGGHTWSNAQPRSTGTVGAYKTRVRWNRLGRARIRTYEITCSEAIPLRINDAYVNGTGSQPSERLPHTYRKVS
jgi:hypothetical protein